MEVDSSSEETPPPPVDPPAGASTDVAETAEVTAADLGSASTAGAAADTDTIVTEAVVPQAKLKRSSSAPLLIGGEATTATGAGSSVWSSGGLSPASPVPQSAFHPAQNFREGLRGRAMSVTSSGGPHSPVVPRVHQIRAEEMEAVSVREAQQERELASKLAISQSWDDLCIDEQPPSCASPSPSSPVLGVPRRLHSPPIFGCPSPGSTSASASVGGGATATATSGAATSSPSASSTRQCYSPSVLRPASMRAPSSPSPTRVQRHRSQSPQLVLRPSALGAVKRRLSSDSDGTGSSAGSEPIERAKRMLTLEDSNKDSASSNLLLQVAPTENHS